MNEKFILPLKYLHKNPSLEEGINLNKEKTYRLFGSEIISISCFILNLPLVVNATANNLFQRFYFRFKLFSLPSFLFFLFLIFFYFLFYFLSLSYFFFLSFIFLFLLFSLSFIPHFFLFLSFLFSFFLSQCFNNYFFQ